MEGYLGTQPAYYFELMSPLLGNLGSLENTPLVFSPLGGSEYPSSSVYLETIEVQFGTGTTSNPSVIRLDSHGDVFEFPYNSP